MKYYKISDTLLTKIANSIRKRFGFQESINYNNIDAIMEYDWRQPLSNNGAAAITFLDWKGEPITGVTTLNSKTYPFYAIPSFLKEQSLFEDGNLCSHTYTTSDNYNYAFIKVAAPSTRLTIRSGGAAIVDWGDGTQSINSAGSVSFTHEYSDEGEYIIRFSEAVSISKNFITPYSALWRLHTSTIKSIDANAFQYCSNLKIITFSDELRSVGDNAFLGISNLNALVFPSNCQLGNCLQNVGSRYIRLPAYSYTELNSLKSNLILEMLNFPSSKNEIEENLLANCSSLKFVQLPENCEKINAGSFNGCRSLQVLSIPSTVTTIGPYAFQYCHGLQAIYVYATTPPTLQDSNVFTSNYAAPIYVPKGTLNSYKTATNWILYSSRLREMEDNSL